MRLLQPEPEREPAGPGLNAGELATYRSSGFVLLPGRFTASVAHLRVALDALLDPAVLGRVSAANPRIDLDGTLLKMVEPCLDISPGLAAFAESDAVQSIFHSLFGSERPQLFEDKVHMKMPTDDGVQSLQGAGAFPYHQDRVFWSTYSCRLSTLVVYLDDATEANGALHLLPHPPGRGQELPHVHSSNFPLELADAALCGLGTPTAGTLPAGSAILFDCMTPHASMNNVDTKPRRSLFLSYNPASDGDGYRVVSEANPLYSIGSHNLGHLPCHKIAAWTQWRREHEPEHLASGGATLIWGDGNDRRQAKL
jgi:hypothetical protein